MKIKIDSIDQYLRIQQQRIEFINAVSTLTEQLASGDLHPDIDALLYTAQIDSLESVIQQIDEEMKRFKSDVNQQYGAVLSSYCRRTVE